MFDFFCMCLLAMFIFPLILGLAFGLVVSSWDLFAVSVAGVIACWVLLMLRRD